MQIRMIGSGKMGANLARRLFNKRRQCTVFELNADDNTIHNDSSDVKSEFAFSTNRVISMPVESNSDHGLKRNRQTTIKRFALLWSLVLIVSACATTGTDPRDPYEEWNRSVHTFNDKLDSYVMKPVAKGYQRVTPSIVDRGITNFFSNINDIGIVLNDLLQFKLEQGGVDATRFLVNTTVGVVGLFDVASKFDLDKHNEDFDQTLAVWGVPSGPYLVIPFLGPSTARGVVGVIGDTVSTPVTYLNPLALTTGLYTVKTVDFRADTIGVTNIAEEAALDPYRFFRNAYLQNRQYVIHDGNPPDDIEEPTSGVAEPKQASNPKREAVSTAEK